MNREALTDHSHTDLPPHNPWNFIFLKRDQQLSGKVISIRNNMVYVKIEDHDRLVGRGYYPLTFDTNRGDNVYCKVKQVDHEKKEIMLVIQHKKAS
jgi:ribosomal protein S1